MSGKGEQGYDLSCLQGQLLLARLCVACDDANSQEDMVKLIYQAELLIQELLSK